MLDPYRVIDLTDERGHLAGFMLAMLGAEVILVEPPEGARSRHRGPWIERAGQRMSVGHWYYGRGKRSVVLDFERSAADLATLRALIADADVVLESGEPGRLAALGLDGAALDALNPRLVHASITPFGATGPKSGWHATDLTAWASTMSLRLTGDADRPPVRMTVPQAFLHAAADAACGVLIALHERHRSGRGQWVDASAQASGLAATQSLVLSSPYRSVEPTRMGGGVTIGKVRQQLLWPCADGYVAITLVFSAATAGFNARLMAWAAEEGLCGDDVVRRDWTAFGDALVAEDERTIEEYEEIKKIVAALVSTRRKADLWSEAHRRRVLLAPINTVADVVDAEHFSARGYWHEAEAPGLAAAPFRVPGAFARLSETPLRDLTASPSIGEADTNLLLRRSRQDLGRDGDPDPAENHVAQGAGALAGLKVLDLMWVVAGPTITRTMADFGATVVRVESSIRVDTARTVRPFVDDRPDPDGAAPFFNLNAGKLGLQLDLTHPRGKEVLDDLIRWADVVAESFAPSVMEKWGYGYERIRELNPSVILLSTSLMGQTGPLATFAGFGSLAAGMVGFGDLTGWPDRPPSGPFAAYTDYVAPRFGLAALLAALEHRRRTGQGQQIDLSQAEAALHFLGPAVAAWTASGVLFERAGNDDTDMSPHGVYPCMGDDVFVAIACRDDADWAALAALMGASGDSETRGWTRFASRVAERGEIDAAIERWTRTMWPHDAADRCQRAGVPAHAVLDSSGCYDDAQLRHRNHFRSVPHAAHGSVVVEGPRVLLSRTPGEVGAAPMLGQHTTEVLSVLLGYDRATIDELDAAGALR